MRYFVLVQFCFCSLLGFAHNITLTDSINKSPISFATVYDVNGNLIGRSDVDGNIDLIKGQEYHVSHIGYERKKIICDDNSIVYLIPISYIMPEVSVTTKMKKYFHCKVFFRSVEHVDSVLKYYMDGVREFVIDTKTKKVKLRNEETYYYMSKRKDIAQKKRNFMIGDRYISLPYFERNSMYEETLNDKCKRIEGGIVYGDTAQIGRCEIVNEKNEMILSLDALYPKSNLVGNLFGYTQVLSKHDQTEIYRYNDLGSPTIFDIKSSNSYRHFTLTHKKENFIRDIDVEDVFYVVESEYTDEKKLSTSETLQEDYKKYSAKFPLNSIIQEQLVAEQQLQQ